MSYAIDLTSHGQELKKIYESVISSDPELNWAIFDYRGRELVPGDSGDGGLDEFASEFDESKVQYGIAKVEYNNMSKNVLIGWVGEGAPESSKRLFNAHLAAITKYFPSYHVQITARESDDVSPVSIMTKVDSAAGSKYSNAAGKPTISTKPRYRAAAEGANEDDWGDAAPVTERDHPVLSSVSSAYKPTKVDIAALKKAAKTKDDAPKKEAIGGLQTESSYKPVGKVDIKKIREEGRKAQKSEPAPAPKGETKSKYAETFEKFNSPTAHASKQKPSFEEPEVAPQPSFSKPKDKTPEPKAKHNVQLDDADDDDDEPQFSSIADRMKAFNANVAKARPSDDPKPSKVKQASARWERKPDYAGGSQVGGPDQKPARGNFVPSGFQSGGKTPAQLWAEKHGKTPSRTPEPESEAKSESSSEPKFGTKLQSASQSRPESSKEKELVDRNASPEPLGITESASQLNLDDEKEKQPSFAELTSRFSKQKEPEFVPKQTADTSKPRPEEPTFEEPEVAPEPSFGSANKDEPAEPKESNEPEDETFTVTVETAYEKEDDDELAVAVGETISDVQKISDDWWFGYNASGDSGLFPASYVKVVPKKASAPAAAPAPPKRETPSAPAPPARETPAAAPAPSLPSRQTPAAPTSAAAPPPPARAAAAEPEPEEEEGPSAIAEFDYDAEDDDELGFKEGAKISNIEFASEDWWSGEIDGQYGLFPADRVRLL